MNNNLKVGMSIVGSFLSGFVPAYQTAPTAKPLTWVMAGAAAVGAYAMGFYQVNPANHNSKKKNGTK